MCAYAYMPWKAEDENYEQRNNADYARHGVQYEGPDPRAAGTMGRYPNRREPNYAAGGSPDWGGTHVSMGRGPGVPESKEAFMRRIKRIVREELDARKKMDEASVIPGMDNVLAPNRWLLTKIMWVAIIIWSVVICSYQLYGRIDTYLQWPTASSVTIQSSHLITFPALTICPFDVTILKEPKMLISKARTGRFAPMDLCPYDIWHMINMEYEGKKLSIEDLYNMSRTMHEFTFEVMDRNNVPSSVPVIAVERLYFVGICFTVSLAAPLHYQGRGTRLVMRRPSAEGCNILNYIINAHEPKAPFNVKVTYYTCENTHVDFAIEAKKFIRQNHPKRPCISSQERSFCYEKCMNQTFMDEVPCTLPYMPNYNKETACKDGFEGNEAGQRTFNIMVELDAGRDCNCPRACDETIYTMTREGVNYEAADNKYTFYYPDNHYMVVEEQYTYDFLSLLSDFGGNLGLWLGLSVISMFELVQNTSRACCKSKKK